MRLKGTLMKRSTALATAALMLASAAWIAPAFADEADDLAPARVQRNWNGTGTATGGGQRAAHMHTNAASGYATPAPAPVIITRPAAATVSHDDDNNDQRAVRTGRGWTGEGQEQQEHREHNRWSREYDLDPAEAERIREAHREADHHVTLRRDRDEDDYVRTYYSPRQYWWHSWW